MRSAHFHSQPQPSLPGTNYHRANYLSWQRWSLFLTPDRAGHYSWQRWSLFLTEVVTVPDSWQRWSLFLTEVVTVPDRVGHCSWQRWSLFLAPDRVGHCSWQGWSLFLTPDHDDHLMTGTCAGQDHALFALSPSHTSHIHHSASVVSILEQRLLCHWTVCKLSHPSLKYTGHSLPMMGSALLAKFRRISFVGSEEVHETYLLSLNWLIWCPRSKGAVPATLFNHLYLKLEHRNLSLTWGGLLQCRP